MNSPLVFNTDIAADHSNWEYDFRPEIDYLKARKHNYIPDIKEKLNRLAGRNPDATINQTVDGVSSAIGGLIPEEYRVTDKQSSTGTKATGLRNFLTDQIGRPQYEKYIQNNKRDLVELLVALRAYDADIPRPVDAVPTSLPIGIEQFIPDIAPERSPPTHHPDVDPDAITKLTGRWQEQVQAMTSETAESDIEYIYAFDATPEFEDEAEDFALLRRHVAAMTRKGIVGESLEGIYRAGYHLNNDDSVYYVGKADEPAKRLDQHLQGATRSASTFPHLFSPTNGLIEITPVGPNEDVNAKEEERAQALTKTGYSWAYYN